MVSLLNPADRTADLGGNRGVVWAGLVSLYRGEIAGGGG